MVRMVPRCSGQSVDSPPVVQSVIRTPSCPCRTQEPLFPARVVYDLLFYFIVIIIVLNLIFGVIIDTFADLRSEKQKKEEILKTTCFICGEWLIPQQGAAGGQRDLALTLASCRSGAGQV